MCPNDVSAQKSRMSGLKSDNIFMKLRTIPISFYIPVIHDDLGSHHTSEVLFNKKVLVRTQISNLVDSLEKCIFLIRNNISEISKHEITEHCSNELLAIIKNLEKETKRLLLKIEGSKSIDTPQASKFKADIRGLVFDKYSQTNSISALISFFEKENELSSSKSLGKMLVLCLLGLNDLYNAYDILMSSNFNLIDYLILLKDSWKSFRPILLEDERFADDCLIN